MVSTRRYGLLQHAACCAAPFKKAVSESSVVSVDRRDRRGHLVCLSAVEYHLVSMSGRQGMVKLMRSLIKKISREESNIALIGKIASLDH